MSRMLAWVRAADARRAVGSAVGRGVAERGRLAARTHARAPAAASSGGWRNPRSTTRGTRRRAAAGEAPITTLHFPYVQTAFIYVAVAVFLPFYIYDVPISISLFLFI